MGHVSQACEVMGDSRDSCSRFKELYDQGGEGARQALSRRKPHLKNRVAPGIEGAVVGIAVGQPAWGQLRAANELAKRGILPSAAGGRWVWERHERENMNKRLKAVEAKVAPEGHRLTEAQVGALENAQAEKEAQGEFVREGPGSGGAQATCSVGTVKGVGRIYPQPFMATYSQGAFAELYDRKTPLTAAEVLNDPVVPFFEGHDLPLARSLTDRGTEYCGSPERHEYELYRAVENMDHTRTQVKSPQTKGICERLHKTGLNEFSRLVFRKRSYPTLAELQADLEMWLREYNEERPPQGRWCFGRTPMQTFRDSIPLAKEKVLAA